MEGPKVPSDARKAPKGTGSGDGRRRPSPIRGSGICPQKKINVDIVYFLHSETVSSAVYAKLKHMTATYMAATYMASKWQVI